MYRHVNSHEKTKSNSLLISYFSITLKNMLQNIQKYYTKYHRIFYFTRPIK